MGHHQQIYQQEQPANHKASWTHEVVAGAAAFEAMKAYEKRRTAEGNHDHTFAREMLAAVAAAEADKLVETKGLNYLDKERAKRQAVQQAHQVHSLTPPALPPPLRWPRRAPPPAPLFAFHAVALTPPVRRACALRVLVAVRREVRWTLSR